MRAEHLEIMVEEPSAEAFLRELLPRLIGDRATFNVYPFQGKDDLLRSLPARLKGYSSWLPDTWRLVVVVDRDDQDCTDLKNEIERSAAEAGLTTRTSAAGRAWQVVNRIAIEELESWYFGDWEAVRELYPKVPRNLAEKAGYRDPDNIVDTSEAFERILQRAGYFSGGLRKKEVARLLGARLVPERNRSRSFGVLRDALLETVQ